MNVWHRLSRRFRGLSVVVAWFVLAAGCASTEGAEGGSETKRSAEQRHREEYGADPMGLAQKWIDGPPKSAPGPLRRRLDSWAEPVVLRVSRRKTGAYRALLGDRKGREGEAILLVIVRSEGSWSIERAESGSRRYLWPEM